MQRASQLDIAQCSHAEQSHAELVWLICAGKDLHKLSLPTHINEPLTDLQRRAEAFEASELLDVVRFWWPQHHPLEMQPIDRLALILLLQSYSGLGAQTAAHLSWF